VAWATWVWAAATTPARAILSLGTRGVRAPAAVAETQKNAHERKQVRFRRTEVLPFSTSGAGFSPFWVGASV
jgi:hypothetical protein